MYSNNSDFELLVAQRKNKKGKRKRKGRNVQGWEKLKERGVLGISSLDGGGIVSAPIAGKALPNIGRRIIRRFARFNPKPIDADNDKLVQEGTVHERPASPSVPTIPSAPRPVQPARYENKTPYGGTKKLIKAQRKQTKAFEAWARARNWKRFHSSHFDWWTFPIDRGSMAYGYEFTPPQEEIDKLKNNIPYLQSLRRAASLYLRSMAWDMNAGDWIDNPDFDRGQEPLVNINQARLFKIARSMQIHGLNDEFRSVRRMVDSLRDAGVKIGNDDYWNNPYAYKYEPLSPINTIMQQAVPNPQSSTGGSVTGRMGISFNPKIFSSVDGAPQRFGIENEPDFRRRYDTLDSEVESAYMAHMEARAKNEGGKLIDPEKTIAQMVKDSVIESFYWKDDRTRIEHAKFLTGDNPPGSNSRTGKRLRVYSASASERKKKRQGMTREWEKIAPMFEKLFGWISATKSGYPATYDLSQALTQTSSTPKREDVATANIVQQLLGILDKYNNPTNYQKAFEEWIRNPNIVGKDKKGNIVGIRLALNDDRALMMAEFDRRISYVKDELAKLFSVDRYQFDRELSPELSARKYIDDTPEPIKDFIVSEVRDSLSGDVFPFLDSAEQLANLVAPSVSARYASDETARGLNGEVLKQLLNQDKNITVLAQILKQKPNIFRESPFDSIQPEELAIVRGMIDLHLAATAGESAGSNLENVRSDVGSTSFDDNVLSALVSERLALNPTMERNPKENFRPKGVTGKMSSGVLDASNTSANPDNPRDWSNHATSKTSGYLSLPEPTDDIEEAAKTGRPISWLMPGQLHPTINEEYNKLVQEIRELGTLNVMALNSPEWQLSDSGSFTPKQVAKQEEIVKRFAAIKMKYATLFSIALSRLGEKEQRASDTMSLGLVQRAASQAVRANFLSNKFNADEMTENALDALEESTDDIFDLIDRGMEQRVAVTAPASVLENIFADGRYKTQHETDTSQGAYNPLLRKVQELAMFSIHPNAKQRPIYGTVNMGIDEENGVATSQYGAATIILKQDVNDRTTWSQADSLSNQINVSTLQQSGLSWDGLYSQSIHPKVRLAYFTGPDWSKLMEEMSGPQKSTNWPFVEAQVHGGISVDDISHIIVDEAWFENNPEMVATEFGPEFDESSWMESPKWIQISKVAESLNIPIVMLREGLGKYEVLEEPGR